MEFFDNALNKAKDALDITRRKTDEIVTIQKLKFDIASTKRKRSYELEKLGVIYFKMIQNEDIEDEEILSLVEGIKEKTLKIKELRYEIDSAKENNNDEI